MTKKLKSEFYPYLSLVVALTGVEKRLYVVYYSHLALIYMFSAANIGIIFQSTKENQEK